MHWSSGGVAASQSALGWGPCPQKLWAGGQAGPGSVLGQVGRSALSLPREGLEALGGCLVCWWGRGLRRGLHVGEGGSAAVAGGGPHRGLQHLHGVAPLAAGAGDCIERCTWARQGAGQRGRVLPGGFGRPRFGFVILRDRRGYLVAFLAIHPPFPPPPAPVLIPTEETGCSSSPPRSPGATGPAERATTDVLCPRHPAQRLHTARGGCN